MLNLLGALFVLAVSLEALVQPHEDYTCDQWIPTAAGNVAGGVGRCGPWVRDGFVSVQVNVDKRGCNIVGDAANEPSIAIAPNSPRQMVIGWRQFDNVESNFRQAGWGYSHDAGVSWSFPGSLDPGVFGSDPVLGVHEDIFFYLTIKIDLVGGSFSTRVFRSADFGLSWPLQTQLTSEPMDKPWLAIDNTGGQGHGNIYVGGFGRLFRSVDRGLSFEGDAADALGWVYLCVGCSGALWLSVGSDPLGLAVWPEAKDPTASLYIKHVSMIPFGGPVPPSTPNPGGLAGQPWLAFDPTCSNLYALCSAQVSAGQNLDVRFTKTSDGGKTWSPAITINDNPLGDETYQWFGMMSVAPNGRIDAVWNDTRNSPSDPKWSELYYAYSIDGGENWSTNIPVSQPFNSWVGWPNQAKLGDYYHMISDNLGVNVAYAATFNGEQDVYFLRIGPYDCNGNETPDEDDIAAGTSEDLNANEVPDECEYRVDVDGDRLTTLYDHAQFLTCLTGPLETTLQDPPVSPLRRGGSRFARLSKGGSTPGCTLMDANHDGEIDLADFAFLQRAFAP